MPDDLLSTGQVAELLGISPGTWRGYVHRHQAPAPDPADAVDKRTPRWRRDVIEAWAAQRPGRGGRRKETDQ